MVASKYFQQYRNCIKVVNKETMSNWSCELVRLITITQERETTRMISYSKILVTLITTWLRELSYRHVNMTLDSPGSRVKIQRCLSLNECVCKLIPENWLIVFCWVDVSRLKRSRNPLDWNIYQSLPWLGTLKRVETASP